MRLAVSSFCRIDLPLAQALPLLHSTTTTVELFCEAPHLDLNSDWHSTVRWLRAYARANGIRYTLHAPCFDLNPAAANAGVRGEVARQYGLAIQAAAMLEAPQIVVHSGHRSDPRLSAAAARAHTRALLEALLPQVEQANTRLLVENTGYGEASSIAVTTDLLEIVEGLPETLVGLTLDLGHAALQGIDFDTAITAWMPRLANVHLHDNHGAGDDHLSPGQGDLPLKHALDSLQTHGYNGTLVLEAFLGGAHPLDAATVWQEVIR